MDVNKIKGVVLSVFLLVVLWSYSGCRTTSLPDTYSPDTVRVYITKPDTTVLMFARQYREAFKFGVEEANKERMYVRNQSHQPDSVRQAYEARIDRQLLIYKASLAQQALDYFIKLIRGY